VCDYNKNPILEVTRKKILISDSVNTLTPHCTAFLEQLFSCWRSSLAECKRS